MSVSIYFSNQIIQIAVGRRGVKPALNRVYTTNAPEGSIINGIVMDSESLSSHLLSFLNANNIPKKDVYLVLNSNKIVGKTIEIPPLNQKKTLNFIMRDFSDMQRDDEENTPAYIPLGVDKKSKLKTVYGEMAPKDQIREFIQMFDDMNIELKGIISGEGSIIGYAYKSIVKKCKTFVLQIINGNLVSNVLYVDGDYKYYNSVRCFNEPGTDAYLDDLARSLTQLEQFMSAQKLTPKVDKVFVAGTMKTDISQYSQVVREHGNTAPIELYNPELSVNQALNHDAMTALFAVTGLYDLGKESNFLSYFKLKDDNADKLDALTKRRVVSAIITFIVMIVLFGIALTLRLIRDGKYKDLKDYNSSSVVIMAKSDYDEAVSKRDTMLAKYNSINTVTETLDSYPVGSAEIVKVIEDTARGYAEIEITSFDADEGKIGFSAMAENVNDIYKYIDELLKEDVFREVNHTGYTYDESKGLYNIHVDCILAESAGRSE